MIEIIFNFEDGRRIIGQGFLGETLMAVAKRYHIQEIRGICGGNLSCASCHLLIRSPNLLRERSEQEEDMLYTLAEPYPLANSRLSCQVVLTNELNGLEVDIVCT